MVRPSYASVTATLALFISLGGGAYAAGAFPANSVGAKQIKKNAVERAKLKNNAVDGSKILDGSITGADIDTATLDEVPTAAVATNATHANAAATLDRVVYKVATAGATPGGLGANATAACDPGLRVVGGGVKLDDPLNAFVVDSYPDGGNTTWTGRVYAYSEAPAPVGFTVYAICTSVAATS